MKKMWLLQHNIVGGAGKLIYDGYSNACSNLGYETYYFVGDDNEIQTLLDYKSKGIEYNFMLTDHIYKVWLDLAKEHGVETELKEAFSGAEKIYMFTQPEKFPMPWGTHPNYVTTNTVDSIKEINNKSNILKWTFVDCDSIKQTCFPNWDKIERVPLAFDNVSYKYLEDKKYNYDVCFVGGRANNGFDEKYKIMMSHFSAFKDSGLKCGIFVGKNLTHEQENKLLYNSKVSINIHDAYQRELGLDTNERTFKALGLTGVLVSDDIWQLKKIFPDVKTTNDPKEMVKFVKEYVNMPEEELNSIKEKNRKMILENHTYAHRVKQLLEL